MVKASAGENAKTLRESKYQLTSPKKFKSSQPTSPKRSRNSGKKLWYALNELMDIISELEETKLIVELKKDTEISEEQLNKIVALKKQIDEETEQMLIPPFKQIMQELKGTRIEKLSMELKELAEIQGKEIQKLCKKLKSGAGTEEDQHKLNSTVKELVEEYSEELINYIPDSNPIMLYTSVIGSSLSVGLITSTVLEHTTRLSMLAIIGIATTSAIVAGCATYIELRPNTKVSESKEVHINCKRHDLV